ncbi:hypothetical protein AB3480_06405 [Rhizobium mongolense]|uniref:hypothetical protein n=1 Tax=Rhizobium mongolense TaxID=57676 RepID=UPI0034A333C6
MVIEIRLYVLQDNGELEPGDNMPLEEFGQCPSVGDVLCLGFEATAFIFYSVVSRYFMRTDNGHGWALIVRENPAPDVNDKVLKAWLEDDAFWTEADRRDEAKREKQLRETLARLDKGTRKGKRKE